MRETIEIHQRHGLTEDVFREVVQAAEYNPGVVETLSELDRSQFEIVLISGGFRELAARAQQDIGIIHAFAACEYLFSPNGRLRAYTVAGHGLPPHRTADSGATCGRGTRRSASDPAPG